MGDDRKKWWIWAGLAVLIAGMGWSALDPRAGGGAYSDSADPGYSR